MSNIIKESIENTIGGNGYAHAKVSQWTNAVVESCLASLTKLQKPFKYIGKLSKSLMERRRRDIFILFFSDLCDYAEKWRWIAYSQLVLLGQFYRWKLYGQMGKQDHVLHCFCLWTGDLKRMDLKLEKRRIFE